MRGYGFARCGRFRLKQFLRGAVEREDGQQKTLAVEPLDTDTSGAGGDLDEITLDAHASFIYPGLGIR
jgi:hypothetical protein